MKALSYLFLLIFILQCKPKNENSLAQFPGKPEVPSTLKNVHAELLAQLHQFTLIKDSSAKFSLKLQELMLHHFKEEEDFVLPPLGLLPSLASGQLPEKTNDIIKFNGNIRSQMDHLSAEHQLIKAYIEELKQASTAENQPGILEFGKEVSKHAVSEEEVYFPAAILVGEYLKLKTQTKP